MKTSLFSLFVIVILGSCNDKDPLFCTKNIDLGEFTAQIEMPYDTFQYIQMVSENDGNAGISVNHPGMMNGPEMFYHKNAVHAYSSDCETLKTVEKYNWKIKEKQNVLLSTLTSVNSPALLLKAVPIIEDVNPNTGPVGYYYEMYERDPLSGVFKSTAFLRIMVKELVPNEGSKWEKGYVKLNSFTIAGHTFDNVITNSEDLEDGVKQIYFTLNQGLVGLKDAQNTLWRVNE